MAKVILLTDTVLWGEIGNGRYMGAYAIASQARKMGYDVMVIDYFTRHPDFFKYLENFLEHDTIAVGISSTFLAPLQKRKVYSQRSEALTTFFAGELWFQDSIEMTEWMGELKSLLKRKTKNAKLVLGGAKSQYAIWRHENYKDFDYVFVGPSDYSFSHFLKTIEKDEIPPFRDINGIRFVDNSFDINNKFCPEALWSKREAVQHKESLPLELARGCIFNCKFCHYNKQESFKKDADILRNEMIRNYELFGTDTYSFCDDCFNDHPNKVKTICEMFLSLPFPIEWVAYARVDFAVKYPWTLDLMMASGARGLYWGIESFNHEVARRAGKGTPPDKVKELLFRLHNEFKNNCITEISLITGLPGETDESLLEMEQWLVQNPIVDIVSVGSLGLAPYVENLDKKLFDYADYSRNPTKYGFTKVEFKPDYWEHDTMNLPRAKVWAERIRQSYVEAQPRITGRSIWLYPHLKTLGYSSDEALAMYKTNRDTKKELLDIENRFQIHLEKYWADLLKENSIQHKSNESMKVHI